MWPFGSQSPTKEKLKSWAQSGKVKPIVKAVEKSPDSEIRIAAIQALAATDSRSLDDRARTVLSEQLKNSDRSIREAAVEACASNPDPKTADSLFAAIEEATESVRKTTYNNLTHYLRKTRKELVELSQKTGGEPPEASIGRAASAVKEMWAAAGGDADASHALVMRSIRGDAAAGWAYWQSESLRRTATIKAIGLTLIAHVERKGTYDVLLKILDDICLGEPNYEERFQNLQRVVDRLRESRDELRQQASKAVIAILTGHSVDAGGN